MRAADRRRVGQRVGHLDRAQSQCHGGRALLALAKAARLEHRWIVFGLYPSTFTLCSFRLLFSRKGRSSILTEMVRIWSDATDLRMLGVPEQ